MSASTTMIRREGATLILEATGKGYIDDVPGVECLNPAAPAAERQYRKAFRHPEKRFYRTDQFDEAVAAHLAGKYALVVAMNGYSRLTNEQCAAWGVKPGAYEKACSVLLTEVFLHIRRRFPDAVVRFAHGSSDMGVDRAISETATRLRCTQLGFTCLDYLWYAPDNEVPLYVADDADAYSDAFVRASDILIAANGRKQAYEMDIAGVFKYSKSFLPVNVLKLISTNGGPPATNAKGGVEDAVAHFQQRIFSVGDRFAGTWVTDPWADAIGQTRDIITHICRNLLPPDVGLEIHE